MSLQNEKLGKEDVELNEADLDVIAGGGQSAMELANDDIVINPGCTVNNNC